MRLTSVIRRLQTQVTGLRSVLAALTGAVPPGYPTAYVLPIAESATANEMYPRTEQRVTARFGVEYMVKQAAQSATGGPAQEALEDLRDAGKTALIGWTPDGCTDPVEFAGGRMISFDAGMAIWRDDFTTAYYEVSQ